MNNKSYNYLFGQKNNILFSLKNFPLKTINNNDIENQYSTSINETIILSEKEKVPEKQLIVFFLQRAKKIYDILKNKKRKQNSSAYINLLNNHNKYELLQVVSILEKGIKMNAFQIVDTHRTGKAMINAIKGFDFSIYQGNSFEDLRDEIEEVVRIFLNSLRKE